MMKEAIGIYKFDNYKEYIKALVENSPNNGRGQFRKISEYLNVHSSLISQVVNGHKDFSMEQSLQVCSYFNLNKEEKDYFLLMVQIEKSGTTDLKEYYGDKLEILRNNFLKVSSRVKAKKKLNESDLALYYSDWIYVAIWLSTSLESIKDVENIASYFNLDPLKVSRIVNFLINNGLCVQDEDGLKMGVTRTHLDSSSPLIKRHHTNWRLKAVEKFETLSSNELAFSAPLSISHSDFDELKLMILDFIEGASKKVKNTNPETLACFKY